MKIHIYIYIYDDDEIDLACAFCMAQHRAQKLFPHKLLVDKHHV